MKLPQSDRMIPPSAALAAILLAFGFPTATAATDKSGIIGGETWTPAMSPIRVVGDITVANLTIQPGVEVLFTGNFEFDCPGVLTAVGDAANKIWFHGDTGVTWKGINFLNSAPGSVLDWCIVENSNDRGIAITNSGPVISNCEIKNNTTAAGGGGIYVLINVVGTSIPSLSNCEIKNNTTNGGNGGGGIYINILSGLLSMNNCVISNNLSDLSHGGGIRAITGSGMLLLTDCTLEGNNAGANGYINLVGGGVYVSGNSEFLRCRLTNNIAGAYQFDGPVGRGGGIYSDTGKIVLRNCSINGNGVVVRAAGGSTWSTTAHGGGIYISGSAKITNCLFSKNTLSVTKGSASNHKAGGLYVNSGVVQIENSTVADNNREGIYCAGGTTVILNSIIYFNNSNGAQIGGVPAVSSSDVQNGYSGAGNINTNPILNADYTLNAYSPCVDMGSPAASSNDGCLYDAVNSPHGGLGGPTNDMGAFGGPGNVLWQAWSGQLEFLLFRGPGTYRYGDTVTLQAWLNGLPYSYQWYKDGAPVIDAPPRVTGATTDKLTILNAGTTDIGNYQLVCDDIDTSGAVALKPLVLELVPDTAATHITVRAAPGKTFRVECSDTLAPGSWSTLSQFVLPSSPHTIDDTERASYPKRFYRATEVP